MSTGDRMPAVKLYKGYTEDASYNEDGTVSPLLLQFSHFGLHYDLRLSNVQLIHWSKHRTLRTARIEFDKLCEHYKLIPNYKRKHNGNPD